MKRPYDPIEIHRPFPAAKVALNPPPELQSEWRETTFQHPTAPLGRYEPGTGRGTDPKRRRCLLIILERIHRRLKFNQPQMNRIEIVNWSCWNFSFWLLLLLLFGLRGGWGWGRGGVGGAGREPPQQ